METKVTKKTFNNFRNKLNRWKSTYRKVNMRRLKRKTRYIIVRDRRKLFVEIINMLIDETDVQTADECPDKVFKLFQMEDEVGRDLKEDAVKFQELDLRDKLIVEQLYIKIDELERIMPAWYNEFRRSNYEENESE